MKRYKIVFASHYVLEFKGEYLRHLERPNWHYYKTADGRTIHIRKEQILFVEHKELEE